MIHFEGLRFRAITSDMTYSDFQAGCRKGTWERWGWGVGGSRGWGVGAWERCVYGGWGMGVGAAKGQFRFVFITLAFKIQLRLLYSIRREIINFVVNYTRYHSKHDI